MTAPDMSDGALAALALLDCAHRRDQQGADAILRGTDRPDLVGGLIMLAAFFRAGMAAANGCPEAEVTAMTRKFLQGEFE